MNNDGINNDKISVFRKKNNSVKTLGIQIVKLVLQTYRGIPLSNSILSFKANTVMEVTTSVISNVSSKGKTTLTAKERFLAEVICRTITRFFFLQKNPVCLVTSSTLVMS